MNDELPADRAVACPPPDAVDPDTFCLDPFDDSVLATFRDLALTDVVVAAPTVGDITPGTTVTLPFTAAFTGAAAGPLALAASTDLPGATATPGSQALAPGERAAPVALAIPAAAAPGRYAVTLSAALGNEARSATAAFTVLPDTTKPVLSKVRVKGTPTRRSVARRGLALRATSSEPVRLVATLRAGRAVRRKLHVKRPVLSTATAQGDGPLALTLKLKRPAAKRLRAQHRRVRLSVRRPRRTPRATGRSWRARSACAERVSGGRGRPRSGRGSPRPDRAGCGRSRTRRPRAARRRALAARPPRSPGRTVRPRRPRGSCR